jgi:hypothetical protein
MSLFRIFLSFAVFAFLLFLSFLSCLSISNVNISSVSPSAAKSSTCSIVGGGFKPYECAVVRRYSHFWARFCIIRKKKLKSQKYVFIISTI